MGSKYRDRDLVLKAEGRGGRKADELALQRKPEDTKVGCILPESLEEGYRVVLEMMAINSDY
jgi:hypothetical protein